jgi:hypothetical protein
VAGAAAGAAAPREISEMEWSYPSIIGKYIDPAAWDAWFAGLPQSENIEDRRPSEPEELGDLFTLKSSSGGD